MSQIRVSVIDPTGSKKTVVELPSNIPVGRLTNALVRRLGYPLVGQNGREIVYRLAHARNGQEVVLSSDFTLEQEAVRNDDLLHLYAEMTAGCFPSGTLITLANGQQKPIQNIKKGEYVLSGIPNSETLLAAEVVRVYKGSSFGYLVLNGILGITESHLVWSDGKWTPAGELKIGSILLDRFGENIELKSIERQYKTIEVYNLSVSSIEHTFFTENILVHNLNAKAAYNERLKSELELKQHSETSDLQGDVQRIYQLIEELKSGTKNVETAKLAENLKHEVQASIDPLLIPIVIDDQEKEPIRMVRADRIHIIEEYRDEQNKWYSISWTFIGAAIGILINWVTAETIIISKASIIVIVVFAIIGLLSWLSARNFQKRAEQYKHVVLYGKDSSVRPIRNDPLKNNNT